MAVNKSEQAMRWQSALNLADLFSIVLILGILFFSQVGQFELRLTRFTRFLSYAGDGRKAQSEKRWHVLSTRGMLDLGVGTGLDGSQGFG